MQRTSYKFRTNLPVDRDVIELVLIRYTWDDDESVPVKREVLTQDGWYEFQEWEIYPNNLPSMDGIVDANRRLTTELLHEFEMHIRGLLKHEGLRVAG